MVWVVSILNSSLLALDPVIPYVIVTTSVALFIAVPSPYSIKSAPSVGVPSMVKSPVGFTITLPIENELSPGQMMKLYHLLLQVRYEMDYL